MYKYKQLYTKQHQCDRHLQYWSKPNPNSAKSKIISHYKCYKYQRIGLDIDNVVSNGIVVKSKAIIIVSFNKQSFTL